MGLRDRTLLRCANPSGNGATYDSWGPAGPSPTPGASQPRALQGQALPIPAGAFSLTSSSQLASLQGAKQAGPSSFRALFFNRTYSKCPSQLQRSQLSAWPS